MVCTANDLLQWKDFPKGLRVLLLDEDTNSAAEIRSKLEEMEYIVSSFFTEDDALSAISSKSEDFHVAILEVNIGNCDGRFKVLESAKDLPTIMMSSIHCINTMMKCIALGAVEFLHKPLSEEKLKNIWQHVVHKAFNAGGANSESLKPIKEFVTSVLQLKGERRNMEIQVPEKSVAEVHETDLDHSVGSDKFPAPSTPQIKQGERLVDDGDFQDHPNMSADKESGENDGESKFVDITYSNLVSETEVDPVQRSSDSVIQEEDECPDGSKGGGAVSSEAQNKENAENLGTDDKKRNKQSVKPNRKKAKVDWTPELHKKFVQAVERLGVDQAIPSRILELMKVEGLTRHNVASHLQKYRMQRRHILPKEDDRRWPHPRDPLHRTYYPHRPVMAFPPYHSNHSFPMAPVYPLWGQPGNEPRGVQMWGPPGYPPWQPMENWLWKPYSGMHAEAWGCPVMPPPQCPPVAFSQNASGSYGITQNSADFHPGEEVIDEAVKEAISKPWLPLPIGLKPPSTESVLAELSRQGISAVPPDIYAFPPP